MTNHLLLFIKNPQLGRVKTRLAATVGDELALEFYRRLLHFTRQVALETEAERHLFYSDFVDEKDDWPARFFQKKKQSGHDLGERMKAAFQSVFNKNESVLSDLLRKSPRWRKPLPNPSPKGRGFSILQIFELSGLSKTGRIYSPLRLAEGAGGGAFARSLLKKKVVIIGSDCAQLTSDILDSAFQKLETAPFVIGPSFDGGYYLLGMNRFEPSVFDEIEWSSSSVFQKTLEKITALGLEVSLLPALPDIDTEDDWLRFATRLH